MKHGTPAKLQSAKGHEPIGQNYCFEKAEAKEELMEIPGMKGS